MTLGFRGLASSVRSSKLAESSLVVQWSPIESNLAQEPHLLGSNHSSPSCTDTSGRDTYETNLSRLLVRARNVLHAS